MYFRDCDLAGVIGSIFAGNLENCGDDAHVEVHEVADVVGHLETKRDREETERQQHQVHSICKRLATKSSEKTPKERQGDAARETERERDIDIYIERERKRHRERDIERETERETAVFILLLMYMDASFLFYRCSLEQRGFITFSLLHLTHVLIDEDDTDVIPVREIMECLLNILAFGLCSQQQTLNPKP